MLQNADWLFFDIGSTLVDEQRAYSRRLYEIAEAAGVPFQLVYETAISFYRKNKKGDKETAKLFGVPLPVWHTEEETLYPDTCRCLQLLHQKYRIGIIANQLPGAAERLAQYGILQSIDLVISSAEEGVSKPDGRIFDIALARSGCPPQNTVMVGDRIDNDILPAKQIGMHTVWIKQGFGQYWSITSKEEEPDLIVQNLAELCTILT